MANAETRIAFGELARNGRTITDDVGDDGVIDVVLDSRRLRREANHLRHDAIRLRQGGFFEAPFSAGGRLSGALRRFAGDDIQPSRADVERTLSGLGRAGVHLQAVVKLKRPLPEKGLPNDVPAGAAFSIDAVFLSPGVPGQNPIAWDAGTCEYRLPSGPCTQGLSAQFQAWAQSLRPEDAQPLEGIGLHYEELKSRAQEPKVYGFIAESTPQALEWLIRQPEVARIELTDIAFLRSP